MDIFLNFVLNSYTLITIVGAVAIFFYQKNKLRSDRFKQYASDLYKEDNQTAQITSAILLRAYLRRIYFFFPNPYEKDTINLIVAILRHITNGNFQKTLADSISFISNADGQDFQYVNLHAASIKPKYRIDYEITKNAKNINKRVFLRSADFYRSDITQCCIYHINAEKAVFYDCLLCRTKFENCILKGADFRDADVNGVKFIDCELDGANFKGARCLNSAMVKKGEESYHLIDCLNEGGIFDCYNKDRRYTEDAVTKRIFVSKLGVMNTKQLNCYNNIIELLKQKYHYEIEKIEQNEYWDSSQITMIKDRMSQCSGLLVFAFSHIHIADGQIVNKPKMITNEDYSSPWLHIETAMANALYNMPTMIVVEDNMFCNGIFDDKVVQNDDLMYKINYKGSLSEEDKQILSHWSRGVEKYKAI